jgi:hypothetical protein
MIALRRFLLLLVAAAVFSPLFASAATSEVRVLFDVDNNAATGCTVGGMTGVDQVLVTRVVDGEATANVTETHRLVCTNGVLGDPTDIITTGWPAGWQPESGMMVVETRLPFSAFSSSGTPGQMRIGFDGTRGAGSFSALTKPNGDPILFPVPLHRRRAVGAPGEDRVIVLDGQDADWGMIKPLTEGTAGGGASAIKLIKGLGFVNPLDSFVYFDFNLNLSGAVLQALDDTFTRQQGSSLTQPAPGVLANDQPNSLPLTAAQVSTPASGVLTLNPDGGFTYTPYSPNSLNPDSFEYKAVSGSEESNVARVKINVVKQNLAPAVTPGTFSVNENSPNGTAVGTVIATDPNGGDHLTFSIISGNTGGTFAINPNTGAITVANSSTLNFEVKPQYTLVVRATDNGVPPLFDNGNITINVNNVNDAPVAVADTNTVAEEGTLTVAAPGVLANDTDEDVPHTLTAVLNAGPVHAQSFALNANGSYNYTPVVNYVGSDVFTYHANDGTLDSNVVSVTITITPVNDPPSFTSGGAVSSPEDTPYSAPWATAISPGPPDEAGQTLTFNVSNNNNPLFSVQPAIAANGTLSFTPAPNANGVANVTVTLSDNGGGANTSAPVNFTITITSVNDAPVLVAGGGSPSFTEDGAAVAVDPGITVTDVDNANLASAAVTITNLLDAGAETLAANTGGTLIVANYVAPTLTLTGTDTLANYQQVLRSITYANSDQDPNTTARSISFVVNDGILNSNIVGTSVAVIAVNDAPVLTAGGTLNYTENDPASAIDTTLTVTDVDSTNITGATVQITGNYVNGEDVLSFTPAFGITGSFVAGTGTLTLSGTTTLANYQTALRSVQYANTSDNPSTAARTVTWQVNDGGAVNNLSNTPTSTINVTAVNDAPVVTASGGTTAFTEDGGAVTVDNGVTVADVDSATLSSATITISNLLDAGAETLAAPTLLGGATASYVAPTLTISGVTSVANYQSMVQAVTYNNTSNNPTTTSRTISFQVDDGAGLNNLSNVSNKSVSITAVNDAPVVTTSGGTTAFVEDAGAVAVDGSVTVTDVDSATLASATITITNVLDGGSEVLNAPTLLGGVTASFVSPTLTLSGATTLANYQTMLRAVTYNNASNTPNTTNRVINFQVNDGAGVSNLSNVAGKTVSVAATNDAPVVTASGGTTAFTEDGGAVVVDSAVTAIDVDSVNLSQAFITITNLLDAGSETLAAPTLLGGATANYVAPTLTISGLTSVANYQSMLEAVTYNNSSNNPTTTTRSISFQADDGAGVNNLSNVSNKSVSITAVNDAPVVTTSGGTTAFVEDAGVVAVDGALTVTDIDSATLAGATITITNVLDGGSEVLNAPTLLGGVTASFVSPTLTLSGTTSVANYQTMLQAVTYNNSSNTPNTTSRVISFQVDDGAGVNNLSNVANKTVSVAATNDAPVVTLSGGTATFTEAAGAIVIDSGASVSDVDSANLTQAFVTITNLLDAGLETLAAPTLLGGATASYVAPTLTISGSTTVANYQAMLRAVTYNNASTAPNPTQRAISFQVDDGAGVNNLSNAPTRGVDVISVNSQPVVTTSGGTTAFVEDAGAVAIDGALTVTDPDSANLTQATVTIANVLDGGSEVLNAPTLLGGVTASFVSPTLTLSGSTTLANYQTMLRAVTYNNASNTPNTTNRTINFQVNDGQPLNNLSAVSSKTVSVTATNDAPVVVTSGGTTAFTEDGGAVTVDSGVTVTDVDSGTLASATVTISNLLDAGAETLNAPTLLGGATASYVAPTLTISGVTSVANYQSMLQAVTYNNSSQNPTTTNRTIAFQVNDGAGVNNLSNIGNKTVSVTSVNDAPVVTTTGGTSAFVENSPAVVVDSGVTVTDVDSANISSATITITNLLDSGAETLAAPTLLGGATANYVAPTLTISGSTTKANYQSMLQAVTYNNSSNTPTTTNRTISFQVDDGAGVNNLSNVANKTVSVTAVDDPPSLTVSGTLNYTENQAATALNVTVSITDPDSANMSSATVSITGNFQSGADVLGFTNQNGISGSYVAPTLTLTGSSSIANYITALQSVTYANTSDNPSTSARTITFQVNDGTSNSNTQTSTVNVTAVNDPPVNNVPTNAQSVNEDTALLFTGAGNTFSITDPDVGAGNITTQIVATNGTTTIVTPGAVVFGPGTNGTASYTITGTLAQVNSALASLRFDPTLNFPGSAASGTATVTLNTSDNGNTPAPAQSDNGDFINITVNQVNDPPVAGDDAFDTIGNTELRIDLAAGTTPNVPKSNGGTGVRNNDSDPVEGDPFTVTSIVGCGDVVAPYDCTLASGSKVSMNANGTFSFVPSPTLATGAPTDDTFDYVITDQPSAGTPLTDTGTVTIHVFDKVWYVKQGAVGGDGTSSLPLGNFSTLNGAGGAGDSDIAGDYIFVHNSASLTSNIELEANQHLLGEGFGLSIPRNLNGSGSPTNLVAAGTKPVVTSATDTVKVTQAVPIEIRGLTLASTATNPIDFTSTGAYSGSSTLTIDGNTFNGATLEGFDANLGATGTINLAFTGNSWNTGGTHTGNAIDISRTAGQLNLDLSNNTNILSAATAVNVAGGAAASTFITGFANNTVHQGTGGSGVVISDATFDAVAGGAINQVSAGTLAIGVSGDNVGAAGFSMTNVVGDVTFSDLDIFAGTSGLIRSGTGTLTLAVNANQGSILAANGPAVDITGAALNLQLASLTSTTTTTGVNLNTVSGTFSSAAGSITKSSGAGTAFSVASGSVTVDYQGSLNVTSGAGVSLTTNSGTMTFRGGMTLSTGANTAFNATGGGTVNVCDESPCNPAATGALVNTLTTTTGTALNVNGTTIGTNNLEFRSISAGTGAGSAGNGIALNTTGASGGLKVSGTGSAGSGGTIQHKTGADGSTAGGIGIYLNSTSSVSLKFMQLNDFDNYGIYGSSVNGLTMDNVVTSGTIGTSDPLDEGSVIFDGLTGSATVTNSNFGGGSVEDTFRVRNASGTLNRITMTSDTFASLNPIGDALKFETSSTAVINATVQNGFFTSAAGDLFNFLVNGTGDDDLVFSGNALTNNNPAIATGGGGVTVSGNGSAGGNLTFDIHNNSMRDSDGHAILIVKSTGPATFSGTFDSNTIGVAAVADSGSLAGSGIKVQNAGAGAVTIAITNNIIRQYNNFGIELLTGGGATPQSGNLNATVTGNTVANPGTGGLPMNGIHLNGGTVPGDTYTICTNIGGAGGLANSVSGSGANGGTDIRVRQRQSTTVRLPTYGGAATDTTAVQTFLSGRNGGASLLASVNSPPGGGFIGTGTTCP